MLYFNISSRIDTKELSQSEYLSHGTNDAISRSWQSFRNPLEIFQAACTLIISVKNFSKNIKYLEIVWNHGKKKKKSDFHETLHNIWIEKIHSRARC